MRSFLEMGRVGILEFTLIFASAGHENALNDPILSFAPWPEGEIHEDTCKRRMATR
jgi:hypothetical protein